MSKKFFRTKIIFFSFFVLPCMLIFATTAVLASETNGTIDSTYKYAFGENIGWLNFGCDNCNVYVTDTELSGFAWSKQYGWINLNPTSSGVKNNAEGALSGFAWSPNLGWIDFSQVVIDSFGEFIGHATIESDNSSINFNCSNGNSCSQADFKVKTDWRQARTRTPTSGGRSEERRVGKECRSRWSP